MVEVSVNVCRFTNDWFSNNDSIFDRQTNIKKGKFVFWNFKKKDGSMISYVKRAREMGFSVIIFNPNEAFWYEGKAVYIDFFILPKLIFLLIIIIYY